MKPKSVNNVLKLKNRIEHLRKELNYLTAGAQKCHKDEKILEVSTTLDEVIVEYMKDVYSVKND